jgi:hypothetical protein
MARQVGVTACKIRIHPCENNGKSTEFDDGNKTKCFSHKDVVGNAPQEDTSSDRWVVTVAVAVPRQPQITYKKI